MQKNLTPAGIAWRYAIFAVAWILVSGYLLAINTGDKLTQTLLETGKGLAFVAFTAALLYLLLKRWHTDLLSTQNRLQATLDALPDLMFELDPDGRYIAYHSPRLDLLAMPPEAFIGKTMREVMPPDVAEIGMSALEEAGVHGYSHGKQIELTLPDGRHWFELSVSCTRDSAGHPSGYIVLSHDITQRKRAENTILRLSKLYEALSQCNQAIVRCSNEAELFPIICRDAVEFGGMKMAWIGLLDEHNCSVKPAAAFGAGAEYLQGIEISTNSDQPSGRGPTGTALRENHPVWCQDFANDPGLTPWRERGLRYGWASSAALPLMRKGKAVASLTLYSGELNAFDEAERNLLQEMAMDINYALDRFEDEAQRKLSTSALQSSQSLNKIANRVARLGAWAIELPETKVILSDDACQLHDMPPGFSPTLDQLDLYYPSDSLDRIRNALDKCMNDGIPFDEELQFTTSMGCHLWVRSIGEALRDGNGTITKIEGAIQDISEIKLAFEEKLDNERRYHKLFESLITGFALHEIICDETGVPVDYRFLEVNPAFEKLTGLKADNLIGRTALEVIPSLERLWIERYGKVAQTGKPTQFEYEAAGLGKSFDVAAYSPRKNQFVTLFTDTTERRRLEDSIIKLSTAVEQSPSSIIITDLDANIIYANSTFTLQTGYLIDETLGRNPRMLQSGKTPKQAYADMWEHLTRGDSWKGEFINRRKDGHEYVESVLISPVRDGSGRITSYLAIKEDITELKLAEKRIQHLAHFDQLTGLPNRSLLQDHFKFALSLAQRRGEHLAIMFLDLDHFKNINDTLGHTIGDQLLMEVAKRLKSALREEDTISRLGGDEFIFILPGTDANGAAHIAEKLLRVISVPYHIEQHELVSTSSIGIAIYPEDGNDMEILSKNADAAMYQVKQAGRNDFRFFTTSMQANSARNLRLGSDLRSAMLRNQLHLHYQPQVSMQDGHIVGAEALLRWQHPDLGAISPAEFIPIAEETGLIIQIGEWVLRTAAMQMKTWLDGVLPSMVIAVNLSAIQFRHANLVAMVTGILAETGLPPDHLELELTEAVAMDDPKAAITVMDQLFENGIRMSIDDFGTGYSSLSYLKRFKVYKLKIDQSFVHDIGEDDEDKAIVSAIINMASSLGMHTIAEGVETASQLAFLRLHGCDEVQGYYFSKPLPAEEFEAFVIGLP